MLSPVRFSGVYALSGGPYGPWLARFDEVTDAIKQQAARQKLPLAVEEKVHPLGLGEVDLVRYFVTGEDLLERQMAKARRRAVAQAVESARLAAQGSARNIFKNTLDQELAQLVKTGAVDPQEAARTQRRVSLALEAQGFSEELPPLSKLVQVRHELWSHFVVRYPNPQDYDKAERANILEAVRTGNFDVESGRLDPKTPYQPVDTRTASDWVKEP